MRERKEERKQRARGPPTHLYCGERVCLGHKYGVHPGLVHTQPGADLAEDNPQIKKEGGAGRGRQEKGTEKQKGRRGARPSPYLCCGERVCLGHKYGVHPGLVDTQPGADLAEDNLKIRRADFPHDPILHSLDVPSEVLHLRRKEKKRNGKREGRVGTGKGEG